VLGHRDRKPLDDKGNLVYVAPAPVLSGLKRKYDRMPVVGRVLARVPVRRGIAAANLPAGEAKA
jgi:hypothetical protein